MFPAVEDVLGSAGLKLNSVQQVFVVHLKDLHAQFGVYFGEETLSNQWVKNSFSFPVTPCDRLTMQKKEGLVRLNFNMD